MSYTSGNPYDSSYAHSPIAAAAAETERSIFIRRTYLHLFGAILAFAAIEAIIFTVVPPETLMQVTRAMVGGYSWLLVLGAFMVVSWIANRAAQSATSKATQYMGLGLYVVAQAVIFVPLLLVAQFATQDEWLIGKAAFVTLLAFAGLTSAVFISKADFNWLGRYLFLAGWIAITVIMAGIFMGGFTLGLWGIAAFIALACGYILYYTSNVLHHYRTDQYVAASLALFAAVALLFWYVIQFFLAAQRD